MTRLRRRLWPRGVREEDAGAPYVVTAGEEAAELSRHGTAYAALREAHRHGPGARVWRTRDLAVGGEALAEISEDRVEGRGACKGAPWIGRLSERG